MAGKKAQESLTSNKLITIILIILVILSLSIVLFRGQFIQWLKELPGYSAPEDKEVDLSGLSSDELANYGCVNKTAGIGTKDTSIAPWLDLRDFYIYKNGVMEKTKLSLDVDNKLDYVLKVRKNFITRDLIVGHILSDFLSIEKSLISGYSSSEIRNYISFEDLKKIDGSRLYRSASSLGVLCKP
jgi:hypothetical protein